MAESEPDDRRAGTGDRQYRRIGVLGIGNVLMGDDGLGPYVVELIRAEYELEGVEVVELGTPGPELPVHLEVYDAIVVVDAVDAPGGPGTLVRLEKEQLVAGRRGAVASPHEPGLREALLLTELHGSGPQVVRVVGAVPASVTMNVGLSAEIRAVVPAVLAETLRQVEGLGGRVEARAVPLHADPWWERAA